MGLYKSGGIIPEVLNVVLEARPADSVPYAFPTHCPVRGHEAVRHEGAAGTFCTNPVCPAKATLRVRYFASRDVMDIKGLGERLVEQLVASGLVKDPADLYALTAEQVEHLEMGETTTGNVRRVGKKNAEKLVAEIQASKGQELWRFIRALGLPFVGEGTSTRMARVYPSLAAVQEASADDLARIPDVGRQTAESIVAGLAEPDMQAFIARLFAAGIAPRPSEDVQAGEQLAGLTFVVTGTLSQSRELVKAHLQRYGGRAGGALSSLTQGLHQAPEVKGQQSAVGQGVVDNLKKEVTTSLVTAGAAKVASLLVPGGAFVQALLTAFTGVQTLISQGVQIMGVILNALGSVQAIAAGQVAAAAGFVERTIGGSVPIVLTFLGRLVGLGNIGTRIRNTVKKLRTRLDATIEKLMVRVKKAIGQVKTKGQTVTSKVKAAFSGIFKKQSFNAGKEQHSIYFQAKNGRVQLMFASTPREASLQLDYLQHECEALADPIHRNEGLNHIQRARTLAAPTTAQLTTVQDEKDLEKITFDSGLDDCLKQIYTILQRNFMGALDDYVKIQTPIRYDRREQFFKFKSAGQEYNIYISKQGFPQFGPYATHTVKIDMKGNREYTLPDGDFANANIKAGFESPRNTRATPGTTMKTGRPCSWCRTNYTISSDTAVA